MKSNNTNSRLDNLRANAAIFGIASVFTAILALDRLFARKEYDELADQLYNETMAEYRTMVKEGFGGVGKYINSLFHRLRS